MREQGKHTLTNEDYHADTDYISSSQLKVALCPASYKYNIVDGLGEKKSNEGMELGNLVHTMALEPHMLEVEYWLYEGELTKTGLIPAKHKKEAVLNAKGRQIITQQQLDFANRARQNFLNNPHCAKFLFGENGENETSWFYRDDEIVERVTNGLVKKPFYMRVRPDRLVLDYENKKGTILDVKSTRKHTYQGFKNEVRYVRDYDLSAVMYIYVIYKLTGIMCDFAWPIVGNSVPYAPVALYPMSDETYAIGEEKFERAIRNIVLCEKEDSWNYQTTPQQI